MAISRAKAQCYIVASFVPDMLSVASTKNDGPKLFKLFLEFAHHLASQRRAQAERVLDMVREEVGITRLRKANALNYIPLDAQIADALRRRGMSVEVGVGTSRFRVPVAVIDPTDAHRYRVAVLCDDGEDDAEAFERFVHRPRVLEARGWTVMRVNAREWMRNPSAVLDRIASVSLTTS